ncbi:MAG: hypothetical protein CVT95_11320 [Bacteroidetes bacterium HGW-Bacteroidetes-12]|nr:MAG: hypothetical protein CVT95_11320 [Bacteroidetes bacterium HGW-Bacteroidetes-12]
MKKLVIYASLFLPLSAFAGGFQLNLQGLKAAAMGGAATGIVSDASTVFFNPGGMSRLDGHQFTFGFNIVDPYVSVQTPEVANTNQTSERGTPIHFYYSGQVTDKIHFGFLVNNQFGSRTSFDDDWQGRFIIQNIKLTTYMFQPTVSYKIHDKISVGGGFVYAYGDFETEKAIPISSSTTTEGKARLTGDGDGVGFNLGIFSNFLTFTHGASKTNLNLGVSYRSEIAVDLSNGVAEFTNIPTSLLGTFPAKTSFVSKLTLPQVFTAGISAKHERGNYSIIFIYDLNWTGWSSYDTLSFNFDNADTPDSKTTKDWKDVFTHRFGVDVTYKNKYSVRAGVYHDNSPTRDGFVSPELPDITQTVYTGGLGYKVNDKVSIDFSFIRQNSDRKDLLLDANFNAHYKRKVNVYGLALNLKLGSKSTKNDIKTE